LAACCSRVRFVALDGPREPALRSQAEAIEVDVLRGLLDPAPGHVEVLELLPSGTQPQRIEAAGASVVPLHEEAVDLKRIGVTSERTWPQSTPDGNMAVIAVETDDPERFAQSLPASDTQYDRWFQERIREIHGLDVSQGAPASQRARVRVGRLGRVSDGCASATMLPDRL
jgi:hypothetical protein